MEIKEVLELIKKKIEAINPVPSKYLVSRGNNNGFEELVPEIAKEVSQEISDDLGVIVHYGHHFPDMDLILNGRRYGIELKSRNNGSWDTNGNSVFESISDEEYEEIFVLFGSHIKGAAQIKVRYRPYWEVTSAITVTHSPRFKINMNTDNSVFKSEEEYSALRKMSEEEKVLFLQQYLKANTAGVKWFVPQQSGIKPTSINLLEKDIQRKRIAEVLVIFPQDLIAQKSDYNRSAEYLITTYYYYSSSFRDFFSAGGKWKIGEVEFPQIFKRVFDNRLIIREILEDANDSFKNLAYQSWGEIPISLKKDSFLEDYKRVLDYLGNKSFLNILQQSNIKNISALIDPAN